MKNLIFLLILTGCHHDGGNHTLIYNSDLIYLANDSLQAVDRMNNICCNNMYRPLMDSNNVTDLEPCEDCDTEHYSNKQCIKFWAMYNLHPMPNTLVYQACHETMPLNVRPLDFITSEIAINHTHLIS